MKKIYYILFLVIIVGLISVSCKKNNDSDDTIIPDSNDQLDQTVDGNDLEGSSKVSFTTKCPWTSSIEAADNDDSSTDWINISPSSGSTAGSYTVTINLDANNTGKIRTVNIIIASCGSKLAIKVTQTPNDDPPNNDPPNNDPPNDDPPNDDPPNDAVQKLISSITWDRGIKYYINFTYDGENRVTNIEHNKGEKAKLTVTYTENIVDVIEEVGGSEETIAVVSRKISLNDEGNAVEMIEEDVSNRTNDYIERKWEYQNKFVSKSFDGGAYTFKWSENNLTQLDYRFDAPGNDYDHEWSEYFEYDSSTLNDTNLDIYAIITDLEAFSHGCGIPHILNLLGKRSKNMVTKVTSNIHNGIYEATYEYETDDEKYITKIHEHREFNGGESENHTYTITYK